MSCVKICLCFVVTLLSQISVATGELVDCAVKRKIVLCIYLASWRGYFESNVGFVDNLFWSFSMSLSYDIFIIKESSNQLVLSGYKLQVLKIWTSIFDNFSIKTCLKIFVSEVQTFV